MNLNLAGRSVVVTGSSRGIGLEIAEGFLREGARVMLTGRRRGRLAAAAEKLKKKFGAGAVRFYAGDLTREAGVLGLRKCAAREFSSLDALVCNLGGGKSAPPGAEDPREWERVLRLNLISSAATVKALAPLLGGKSPSPGIVFVSSICASQATAAPLAYSAAKAALESYAQNIAAGLARRGIRVNTVAPGHVMFQGSSWEAKLAAKPGAVKKMIRERVPLARFASAREVADSVLFLASDKSSYTTGAVLVVDGGLSVRHG